MEGATQENIQRCPDVENGMHRYDQTKIKAENASLYIIYKLSNPSLWELEMAQWLIPLAALPGDWAQLLALTLEGSHKLQFQGVPAFFSGL